MKAPDSVTNVHVIDYLYGAGFTSKAFVKASDLTDFGPEVAGRDVLADDPPAPGRPKPVRFAPVPRRNGTETFPEIVLDLGLAEKGRIRSVSPASWQGLQVDIEVVNVWDRHNPKSLKLTGTLKDLYCMVKVSPDTVQKWLDPSGPFGAQVNENLFDFHFSIPSIPVKGQPYAGQAYNRVYFYRRKILVFFPGVFGSQVQVTAPDGQVLGYPDFFDEAAPPVRSEGEALAQLGDSVGRMVFKQRIGVLECDQDGKPLADPNNPTLLRMGGIVYDAFENLRDARRRHFPPIPRDLKLFRLFLAPYDWRLDLTDTALAKLDWLQKLQEGEFGRNAPDSDDQLALAGHSTGGVLIRRILAEPAADSLISHAFFMNVPFRGAAKPMAVIPTGCDPLTGDAMIPFVKPKSLRAIALTAPIVYHLSASSAYPVPIFTLRPLTGPETRHSGLEAEKKWVQLAIEQNFMPARKVIPSGAALTAAARRTIALGADAWAEYWDECWEHRRGRTLIRWAMPGRADGWELAQLAERKLASQSAARVDMGWNDGLAARAKAFHERCEQMAQQGKWKDKSYIFYSIAEGPTTLALHAQQLLSQTYRSVVPLLEDIRVPVRYLWDRDEIQPPIEEGKAARQPLEPGKTYGLVEDGVWMVESFTRRADEMVREKWRFATIRQIDGDGTVPLRSLIGFGGEAKVFKKLVLKEDSPLPVGPDHTHAPKHDWAWDRIVDVLQGVDPKALEEHLDKQVDTTNGIDPDDRLRELRERYYHKANGG